MLDRWTNFIKSGDPGLGGDWPVCGEDRFVKDLDI
jgi:hypothetical protein